VRAGGVTLDEVTQEVSKGVEPVYRRVGDVETTANSFYRRTEEYEARIEAETAAREARYAVIQQGNDTKIQQLEEGQQLNEQQYTALTGAIAGVGVKVDSIPDISADKVDRKITPKIDSISNKIDNTFDELGALKVASIAGFTNVAAQTTRDAIAIGAEQGVCQATTPDGCLSPTGNWASQLGNTVKNNLDSVLGGLNALLNTVMLPIVTSTNQIVRSTEPIIKRIDTVTNTTKSFVEKAWKATNLDKAINVLNTALLVHNGVMLSNGVYSTVTEILDNVLSAFNIKDYAGNEIDTSNVIGNTIKQVIKSIVGASTFERLSTEFKSKIRVYQAAANLASNVREIVDLSQDITETMGENVSFIGNALKNAGVVRDNAYPHMVTDFKRDSRISRFLEKTQDALDPIEDISDNVRDISEEISDMKENQRQLDEAYAKAVKEQEKPITNAKTLIEKAREPIEEDTEKAVDPNAQ
jgi:hypothetical protein